MSGAGENIDEPAAAPKRYRHLGEMFRDVRQAQGLSIQDVAERAFCSVKTVMDVEHDKTNPRLSTLTAIAVALDYDIYIELIPWVTELPEEVTTEEMGNEHTKETQAA